MTTKHDGGKLRYDLLPPIALRAVVAVLTKGAAKYAPNNWRNVEGWRDRYYAACMLHLEDWREGKRFDVGTPDAPGTGEHSLACAICSLVFMLVLDIEGGAE